MKVKQVLDEAVVKAIVDAGYEGMLIVRVWWGACFYSFHPF